jgi:hypothetical protein
VIQKLVHTIASSISTIGIENSFIEEEGHAINIDYLVMGGTV